MEIIELPGYTEKEKLMIAKNYLLPRQLKAHGLTKRNAVMEDDAILSLIQEYTREAGVRNLERGLGSLCRKIAFGVASGSAKRVVVDDSDKVADLLKSPRYTPEMAERTSRSGVAVGLVWTPVGGDIQFIEATKMPGKGKLTLTGKLGDVMKESAQAALSVVRSKAYEWGIENTKFDEHDIHIHAPAGSIPKDGPSAGITLVTVLTSLLLDKPIMQDLAMTGEITLRGVVLPVGGVRDKILAAHRAGVKHVILPKRNDQDLEEVAPEVRADMNFHFVEAIDEVIQLALDLPISVALKS
jgi:ATP-dependent Lon protease